MTSRCHFSLIKAKENKNDLNKQHVTLIKSEGKEYEVGRKGNEEIGRGRGMEKGKKGTEKKEQRITEH